MPKGIRISGESKLTMYNLFCEKWSPNDIFHLVFNDDPSRISLEYVTNRYRFFETSDADTIAQYIIGTEDHGGRPRKMDTGDDILLKQIIDSSNTKKLGALLLMYAKIKGTDPGDISISSIYRAQVRIKYTIKNLTRYNFNANPLEAAEFFQKMRHVPASSVINFDATNTKSGESLKETQGRSEAGYPAIKVEFIIKNKPWCVVAAYSPLGFLCWRFFQGTGRAGEEQHLSGVSHVARLPV